MPQSFDPYHTWLSIPPERQPPNHYDLLGTRPFEDNIEAIAAAADRQMGHLRSFQTGKHSDLSQKLLNEVATARVCLLDPQKKAAYDRQLQQALQTAPRGGVADYEQTVDFEPGANAGVAGSRLGEYELIEKLGQGGMGTVYRALHTKLGREVALKVLPKGKVADERAVARFEREMKAIGVLDHPNIVRASDAREVRGTRFLAMDLVKGLDLKQVVQRVGPLPIADACEIARQAALALQCAHEHGLVHRDVKPSNLMLDESGQVKLLDLGLALFQAGHPADEEMTATGQTLGTLDYIAPEQAADTHSVDIRADIYSLGCTLFKLLTGRAPFEDPKYQSPFEKMTAHVKQPPPRLARLRPDAPKELVAVVNRMLSKDPARRFATPAKVADAVGPMAGGSDLADLLARGQRKPTASKPSHSMEDTGGSQSSGLTKFLEQIKIKSPPLPQGAEKQARSNMPIILGLVGIGLLLVVGIVGGLMIGSGGLQAPGSMAFVWPADQRQDARLFIDEKSIEVPATGPVETEYSPGEHQIRMLREGFEPYQQRVDLSEGEAVTITPNWVALSHLVIHWPAGIST